MNAKALEEKGAANQDVRKMVVEAALEQLRKFSSDSIILVMPIPTLAWYVLALRVLLLGLERPLGKRTVHGYPPLVGALIFFGLASILHIPPLIFLFIYYPPTNFSFLPFSFLNASLSATAFFFYIRSLRDGEISVVAPLYSTSVLFVFFLPIIFQRELFTWWKLLGALLIFVGATWLRPRTNPIDSFLNLARYRPARDMVITCAILSLGRLVDNYAADINPYYYALFGSLSLGVIFLAINLLRGTLSQALELYRERRALAWLNGLVNGYAYFSLVVVLGLGIELSVAEPVSSISMLISVSLGFLMFGEKIEARLFASILMIFGVFALVKA